MKQLSNEFPNLFERKGRSKNHQVKTNLKSDAKLSQQKGMRIPIQLQNAVDAEIKRLLKEGHIVKKLCKRGRLYTANSDNCKERPFGEDSFRCKSVKLVSR